eukprot:COSAG05_NODE_9565_length_615_cov_1.941860_1_plen_102_part_01
MTSPSHPVDAQIQSEAGVRSDDATGAVEDVVAWLSRLAGVRTRLDAEAEEANGYAMATAAELQEAEQALAAAPRRTRKAAKQAVEELKFRLEKDNDAAAAAS